MLEERPAEIIRAVSPKFDPESKQRMEDKDPDEYDLDFIDDQSELG